MTEADIKLKELMEPNKKMMEVYKMMDYYVRKNKEHALGYGDEDLTFFARVALDMVDKARAKKKSMKKMLLANPQFGEHEAEEIVALFAR